MKKRTKLAWKMGIAGAILTANVMAMANIRLEPEYTPTSSMEMDMSGSAGPTINSAPPVLCEPKITFHPGTITAKEDFSLRFGDIDRLTKESTLQQTSSGQGIGVVLTRFAWRPSFASVNGCPSVQVQYGFQDTKLYVANDLTGNKCAFEQVLLHERRHLDIYQEWLKRSQERLNAAFKDRSKDLLGTQGLDYERNNIVDAQIKEAIQQEYKAVLKEQEEHDSPEEYARNDQECNRAIPRLLKRAGYVR